MPTFNAPHAAHAPHERRRQKAFALHDKGDYPAAKAALQSYLRSRPGDPTAVNLLAALHHRLGDTDSAIRLLRPLAAQAQIPAFNLAVMLVDSGQLDEAERALLTLIRRYPDDTDALRQLARVHVRRGDHAELYAVYEAIRERVPLSDPERGNLLLCLEKVVVNDHRPQREQDMLDYFADPAHMPEEIRRMVFSHLAAKYRGLAADDAALLEAAASDAFLHQVLHELLVTDPAIEADCVRLRRGILDATLRTGALAPQWLALAAALVAQYQLNEYIHRLGEDEAEAVAQMSRQCESELSSAQPELSSLAVLVLLVSMYREPACEPWVQAFLAVEVKAWPDWLHPLRESVLLWQRREVAARDMPRLTSIEDAVSKQVKAQYEQNPYPRWRRCKLMRFDSIAHYLSRVLPGCDNLPPALADGCRVLSAGCGTGKEPIEFARAFPRCEFLAIDLSSRSLAYAQAKAAEYGLKNIRFAQADILQVAQWAQRFDVILSAGVLHHMHDTLQAWHILRDRLEPQGAMHVALYSRLARTGVNAVRAAIAGDDLTPDLAAMRAVRARCLSGQLPGFAPSRDFYSASACRDLLFHVHERQFDIPELASMLERLSLRFLGFDTPRESLPDLASHFPLPQSHLELDRWHRYELAHPQAFGMMYSLWCTREAPGGRCRDDTAMPATMSENAAV